MPQQQRPSLDAIFGAPPQQPQQRPSLDAIFGAQQPVKPDITTQPANTGYGQLADATVNTLRGLSRTGQQAVGGLMQIGNDINVGVAGLLGAEQTKKQLQQEQNRLKMRAAELRKRPETPLENQITAGLADPANVISAYTPIKLAQAGAKLGQRAAVIGENIGKVGLQQLIGGFTGDVTEGESRVDNAIKRGGSTAIGIGALGAAPVVAKGIYGGAKAIGRGAKATTKNVKMSINELKNAKNPIPSSDEIRFASSQKYNANQTSTSGLSTDFVDNFFSKAREELPSNPKDAGLKMYDSVRNALNDVEIFKGEPMDLARAQRVDESLSDYLQKEIDKGDLSKAGKSILKIRNEFRDAIENAKETDIVGGKEGFDNLKQARALWAQSLRMRDIERIVERAKYTDNPATSLKTGFRTLLGNPDRLRGFKPNEIEAIKRAAQNGVLTGALRILSSRLNPIIVGSTGGGIGGTAASMATSGAARNAATSLQEVRANNVLQEIMKRENPQSLSDLIRNNQ